VIRHARPLLLGVLTLLEECSSGAPGDGAGLLDGAAAVDVVSPSDHCGRQYYTRRYDPSARCLLPYENLGCVPDESCDESLTFAVDSKGDCWWFTSLCVPAGFRIVNPEDPTCPSVNVGNCARD
jgi:hypothetical protein